MICNLLFFLSIIKTFLSLKIYNMQFSESIVWSSQAKESRCCWQFMMEKEIWEEKRKKKKHGEKITIIATNMNVHTAHAAPRHQRYQYTATYLCVLHFPTHSVDSLGHCLVWLDFAYRLTNSAVWQPNENRNNPWNPIYERLLKLRARLQTQQQQQQKDTQIKCLHRMTLRAN